MVVIIGAIIGCTISLSGLGYLFGIPMYKDYIKFRDESRRFTKDTNDKLAIIKKILKYLMHIVGLLEIQHCLQK